MKTDHQNIINRLQDCEIFHNGETCEVKLHKNVSNETTVAQFTTGELTEADVIGAKIVGNKITTATGKTYHVWKKVNLLGEPQTGEIWESNTIKARFLVKGEKTEMPGIGEWSQSKFSGFPAERLGDGRTALVSLSKKPDGYPYDWVLIH